MVIQKLDSNIEEAGNDATEAEFRLAAAKGVLGWVELKGPVAIRGCGRRWLFKLHS